LEFVRGDDVKDTVLRMSDDEGFKRAMFKCELVNILIGQGLQDVSLNYDEWNQRWHFTALWSGISRQTLPALAFAFRQGLRARTWMKIPEDSLWLMDHGYLLTGSFVVVNSLIPDN
jgi:hypothetical protein